MTIEQPGEDRGSNIFTTDKEFERRGSQMIHEVGETGGGNIFVKGLGALSKGWNAIIHISGLAKEGKSRELSVDKYPRRGKRSSPFHEHH